MCIEILHLNKDAVMKIALNKNEEWNGSTDGSELYFIDETVTHVRVAIDTETRDLIMFSKKALNIAIKKYVDFGKVEKAQKDRKNLDNYQTDYFDYYHDICMPILKEIDENCNIDNLYLNAYDYIFKYIDYLKFTEWKIKAMKDSITSDTQPF